MLDKFVPKPITDYLRDKYAEEEAHPPVDPNGAVEAFLTWMEKHFALNLPTNITHLAKGFALNVPDGSTVSFSDTQTRDEYVMRDEAVRVTTGRMGPSSGILRSASVDI